MILSFLWTVILYLMLIAAARRPSHAGRCHYALFRDGSDPGCSAAELAEQIKAIGKAHRLRPENIFSCSALAMAGVLPFCCLLRSFGRTLCYI